MGKKLLGVIGVVFLVSLSAMFAVLATAANARSSTTTLTLWHNYGTEGNAVATNNLVRAFEKSHPDIKIKVVSQPAENYFALLQAASISKTGPDLATMWTGLFALKYQKFIADLKPYFSAAERAKLNGIRYMAPDFNPAKGFLVMPLEVQFYIGFYNKALFKKAGLSGPPESWAELQTACQKLNAKGITPILVGADSQAISATFLPWYDFSYLMAGILSPDQWRGLYTGKVAWNSPLVTAAVTKWAALRTSGCTNKDVLTRLDVLGQFAKGKAAMIFDGNWDTATLQKGLGSKLGAFAPPYQNPKIRGVIQYPGDGFSLMSYSKHKDEAVQFLKFMQTPAALKIVSAAGLIPDVRGYKTTNPVLNEMLDLSAKQGYAKYPMLDNVIQPEVVTVGQKLLVAAFGGTISVPKALDGMTSTHDAIPDDRKGPVYR